MRASYTRISMYMECPAKVRYRYVERIASPKSEAASRGTDKHATLEAAIRDGTPIADVELRAYEAQVRHLHAAGAVPEARLAVDHDWNPVDWTDENAYLIGVLDAVTWAAPTTEIIDWKSGKIYEEDHLKQRELYAALAWAHVPEGTREITFRHIYTDLRKERFSTFHADQIPALRRKWAGRIERMAEDKEMIPTPYFGCRWCPYRKKVGGPCQF